MTGGLHPPAEVRQGWLDHPERLDHSKRGWGFFAFSGVLVTLTLAILSARIWARARIQGIAGVDDALILAAMVCN